MKTGIPEIHAEELSMLKEQATKALAEVEALEIESAEDFKEAKALLEKIKGADTSIQNAKGSVTRRLDEEFENVREMFNPIEKVHQQAESAIRDKIRNYEEPESGPPDH